MSAIYGIVYKKAPPQDINGDAAKMAAALKHRATDGEGNLVTENAFLGFAKLNIAARQVGEGILIASDNLIIVADSLLFQREHLAAKLGLEAKTVTDTQLILAAYRKWKDNCVLHLDGEFAFAIWNKESHELFMATDHIGYRPLYYYETADVFVFSSEIKAITAVKPTPHVFNKRCLLDYQFRHGDPLETYDRDIYFVGGAKRIILPGKNSQNETYWQLDASPKYNFRTEQQWIDCLRETLTNAVTNRLCTDAPVGLTLSGGLDSSSVAGILAPVLEKENKPLYCFSSVLPQGHDGPERDERKYIEAVGRKYPNIIQAYIDAPGAGPFRSVIQAFEADEVFPNGFFYMDRAILEAASARGVKTLFNGFGGDHAVSHKRHTIIYQIIKQGRYSLAARLMKLTAQNEKEAWFTVFRREYLAHLGLYKWIYNLAGYGKNEWRFKSALRNDLLQELELKFDFDSEISNNEFLKDQTAQGYISRAIGTFATRNASFSMGSAMAFFDRHLLELIVSAPLELFVKGGYKRSFLRHAMQDILPEEILWRRDKMPYSPMSKKRLASQAGNLDVLFHSPCRNAIFRYIDENTLRAYISELNAHRGEGTMANMKSIRIMQAGIMALTINHLCQKGYDMG